MRYTISGSAATFVLCLTSLQPAQAQVNAPAQTEVSDPVQSPVNDETDARAFIVRDAEIRQQQSAEAAGVEAPPAAADIGAPVDKPGRPKRSANAPDRKISSAKTMEIKRADAATVEPVRSEPAQAAAAGGASSGTRAVAASIARHAAANGVPFGLADAIVRLESRYNPRAAHAGNLGLMQIRHQTARGMGYSGSASGLLDTETNLRFGMKYLAQAFKLAGGDTCRTIMKYQSGHMAMRLSGSNRTYCAKVRTLTARN